MKNIFILAILLFTTLTYAQTHTGGTAIGEIAIAQMCDDIRMQIGMIYHDRCKASKGLDDIFRELQLVKAVSEQRIFDKINDKQLHKTCKKLGVNEPEIQDKKVKHCAINATVYLNIEKRIKFNKEMKHNPACVTNFSIKELQELKDFIHKNLP